MLNRAIKVVLTILTLFLVSCATGNNSLNATLWMQTAAEYRAATTAIYQSATDRLQKALNDRSWTADLKQMQHAGSYEKLPPAIVLDIDETVLDNSPFQARMILDGTGFDPDQWDLWISKAEAQAIPGAVAFLKAAKQMGIQIIYITNRTCKARPDNLYSCPQEQDTIQNLKKCGFPAIQNTDTLLLQNEQPGWTSEKQSRRDLVAGQYRIIMMFGDDLGDFLPDVKSNITPNIRDREVKKYQALWGRKWFVLPNPDYGSWMNILSEPRTQYLRGF